MFHRTSIRSLEATIEIESHNRGTLFSVTERVAGAPTWVGDFAGAAEAMAVYRDRMADMLATGAEIAKARERAELSAYFAGR